jgi:RND family efflux transporter MFP subunit
MSDQLPSQQPEDIKRYSVPRHLKTIGAVVVVLAVGVVAVGLIGRVHADQRAGAYASQQLVTNVKVLDLGGVNGGGNLVLPAGVEAFNDAPIHARVSGYLKRWYVDIGSPVKAGRLLAEIDTPELDQQLTQAKADLATAQANEALSQTTATRWAALLTRNAVSRQEADEKNGDLAAKRSLVNAAQANVDRLKATEAFKRIVAPFDGTVTSRSTDIGALITVGGASDVPLFTVSDERRLRIYVHVPQSYIAEVQPGMMASFTVPEYPGRTFRAPLLTTSDAVNTQSGALLLQLQIDNADGALKPGDYAQIRFALPAQSGVVLLPATALTFRTNGMAVAVVGQNGRAVVKPVQIGRDFGQNVEVGAGLSPSDRVIDNPPDVLETGDAVRVVGTTPPVKTDHAG